MNPALALVTIATVGAGLAGTHILLNHLFPPKPPVFTCDTGGCDGPANHVGQRHTGDLRWYCSDCWDHLTAYNEITGETPLPGGWGDPKAQAEFNEQEPPL